MHVGAPMISRAARIHGVHSRQRAGVSTAARKAGGGQGGDSAFRPREARSRSKIAKEARLLRAAQKVLVNSGDFARVVCWRVSCPAPEPVLGIASPQACETPAGAVPA